MRIALVPVPFAPIPPRRIAISKISLVVTDLGASKAASIALLRRDTGLSISDIQRRVEARESVLEVKPYGHDLAGRYDRLKALLNELTANGARVELFHLSSDESFDYAERKSYSPLSLILLDNLVKSLMEQFEYLDWVDEQRLAEEDGEDEELRGG